MKKIVALLLVLLCCAVLFGGCSEESAFKATEVENVSIRISDLSSTGATVIIKDVNDKPFEYGEWYKIEKEYDGEWHDVKTVIENYGFEDIAYLLDENSETREMKFEIDWKWLYGELPSGTYRLLKEVNNQHISVTFDIV